MTDLPQDLRTKCNASTAAIGEVQPGAAEATE